MTDDRRVVATEASGSGGSRGAAAPGAAEPTEGRLRAEVVALSACGPIRPINEDRLGWAVLEAPGGPGAPKGSGEAAGPRADGACVGPGDVVPSGAPSAASPAGDGRLHRVEVSGPGVAVVIADGLGGHAHGELASATAVATLLRRLAADGASDRLATILREGFEAANQALLDGHLVDPALFEPEAGAWWLDAEAGDAASASAGAGGSAVTIRGGPVTIRGGPVTIRGGQTTLTALAVHGRRGYLAHVGDCRVFRLRDGVLELLTKDHTQAMELVRMRLIRPEQAHRHPGRHLLTRSIGGDLVLRVETRTPEPARGDTYLLCTDGAWSPASGDEIRAAMEGDLTSGVRALVARSAERGGDDNASVIGLRLLDLGGEREPDAANGWRLPWRRGPGR